LEKRVQFAKAKLYEDELSFKKTLQKIQDNHLYIAYSANTSSEEKIQKVINGMAVKMKQHDHKGCCYLEAINEYIVAIS